MKFLPPLESATLLKRYKRFLADIQFDDGSERTIHCANTGAMTGCATPGDKVWFSTSDNPKRKYPNSWELSQTAAGHRICINTARANQLAVEGIQQGVITELLDYEQLQTEVKYGQENSRIDILLSDPQKATCYIEVKSVTLLAEESQGQGFFPDAVTTRGQKHLRPRPGGLWRQSRRRRPVPAQGTGRHLGRRRFALRERRVAQPVDGRRAGRQHCLQYRAGRFRRLLVRDQPGHQPL